MPASGQSDLGPGQMGNYLIKIKIYNISSCVIIFWLPLCICQSIFLILSIYLFIYLTIYLSFYPPFYAPTQDCFGLCNSLTRQVRIGLAGTFHMLGKLGKAVEAKPIATCGCQWSSWVLQANVSEDEFSSLMNN